MLVILWSKIWKLFGCRWVNRWYLSIFSFRNLIPFLMVRRWFVIVIIWWRLIGERSTNNHLIFQKGLGITRLLIECYSFSICNWCVIFWWIFLCTRIGTKKTMIGIEELLDDTSVESDNFSNEVIILWLNWEFDELSFEDSWYTW